jgi:hypothetical protein
MLSPSKHSEPFSAACKESKSILVSKKEQSKCHVGATTKKNQRRYHSRARAKKLLISTIGYGDHVLVCSRIVTRVDRSPALSRKRESARARVFH